MAPAQVRCTLHSTPTNGMTGVWKLMRMGSTWTCWSIMGTLPRVQVSP